MEAMAISRSIFRLSSTSFMIESRTSALPRQAKIAVDSLGLGAAIGLVEPAPVKDDHDHRQTGMDGLRPPAEVRRVHVGQIAGDKDEVEAFFCQDAQPFLAGEGCDNLRDVLKVQQLGRAVDILRQRVIARDAEGLVSIRDHQDRAHTARHKLVEAAKLGIVGVAELIAKVRRLHRRLGLREGLHVTTRGLAAASVNGPPPSPKCIASVRF